MIRCQQSGATPPASSRIAEIHSAVRNNGSDRCSLFAVEEKLPPLDSPGLISNGLASGHGIYGGWAAFPDAMIGALPMAPIIRLMRHLNVPGAGNVIFFARPIGRRARRTGCVWQRHSLTRSNAPMRRGRSVCRRGRGNGSSARSRRWKWLLVGGCRSVVAFCLPLAGRLLDPCAAATWSNRRATDKLFSSSAASLICWRRHINRRILPGRRHIGVRVQTLPMLSHGSAVECSQVHLSSGEIPDMPRTQSQTVKKPKRKTPAKHLAQLGFFGCGSRI